MIINNANLFITKLDRWVSFFRVFYWVMVLIPICLFGFFVLIGGPRQALQIIPSLFMSLAYLAIAYTAYRMIIIGFEFMKSIVSTTLDCHAELKQIKQELKKPTDEESNLSGAPKPTPYQF